MKQKTKKELICYFENLVSFNLVNINAEFVKLALEGIKLIECEEEENVLFEKGEELLFWDDNSTHFMIGYFGEMNGEYYSSSEFGQHDNAQRITRWTTHDSSGLPAELEGKKCNVLYRNGSTAQTFASSYWKFDNSDYDIIGYQIIEGVIL